MFTDAPGLIGVKYLKSPIRPGSDPPEEVGSSALLALREARPGLLIQLPRRWSTSRRRR